MAAVQENGGRVGPGGVVRLAKGGKLVIERNQFWPQRLSPEICRVVFDSAVRSNTYINTAGSDLAPLKVKGSTLKTPPEMGPAIVVATPGALCANLRGRLARWNAEMGRLRAEGAIGPDDQPLEPPPAPGTEQRLSGDASGVAAQCEAYGRQIATELGWRLVRSVVTQNDRWGVVWRADIAPDADPSTWSRESCWRSPRANATGGISISSRPLRMFDESKSIEPLSSAE
jgi:hypothetical protein